MSTATESDPRPLIGEPLALDLLNTRWIDAAGRHDLLETVDGLAVWLGSPDVRAVVGADSGLADRDTLTHLLRARTALDALVANVGDPGADDVQALNDVLAHGRLRRELDAGGQPRSVVEVDSPSWLPAWHAAENWLWLMSSRPERVRSCANDACVLHFFDVSKNGTRRWCSMAGCGNRAKAQRYYNRHHQP
ncbi:MAG TPA: CGNR zinc finger domain-containing protein [Yinghuangia sp.]|uniref:CGNR zinc finger domain-containing protein n=1 Tax=Yinghuangia sp. YIM S10712 TaxID=3436930 RepID=UPI002C1C9693|nr:CGNR zinc finger domain-containing protein [Yinghuangia sp.]